MSEDEIDDNLDEELFDKIGESMSRAERRKIKKRIKKMLTENISEHKHLFREARAKMKEPGFMAKAKDKSAWCMNGMHSRCNGFFVGSKHTPCQCECHNKDSIEKQ
jgi:hypothetical protein